MKRPITVTDILNSVEFELLQHTLLQNEVTDGIHRLRAYQADARNRWLQQGRNPSIDSLLDLQLNTNEMLLTLIQMLDQRLEALRQELRRAESLTLHIPPTSAPAEENLAAAPTSTPPALHVPAEDDLSNASTNAHEPAPSVMLAELWNSELPRIQMDVRESNTPLLGGVFNRIRMSLHELVLFYVNKVVEQQAEVNRTYGNALRDLLAANRAQALELQELRMKLSQLMPTPQNGQRNDRENSPSP